MIHMYYSSINKMTIIPNPGANLVIIVMGWNGNNLSTGGVGVRGGELLGGDHDDDNAFDDDGYRDHDGVGDIMMMTLTSTWLKSKVLMRLRLSGWGITCIVPQQALEMKIDDGDQKNK